MTNDELLRQVATEIRQHHHSGTMEEALDAAKAVLAITDRQQQLQKEFYELRGLLTSGMTDLFTGNPLTVEAMLGGIMKLKVLKSSVDTGEDYQLLSTEPQIVNETIDPEGEHDNTQEESRTKAGQ